MLNKSLKRLLLYGVITLACGLFSFIYEQHSHQVYSNYMIYLFAVPLALGAFPQLIFVGLPKLDIGGSWQRIIHNFSIATLAIGVLLQGMLEIYGTTSTFVVLYFVVGLGLLMVSIALWLSALSNHKESATYTV